MLSLGTSELLVVSEESSAATEYRDNDSLAYQVHLKINSIVRAIMLKSHTRFIIDVAYRIIFNSFPEVSDLI